MSPRGPRRTVRTPIEGLPHLTLGPGDRFVVFGALVRWLRLRDWLTGGEEPGAPWRAVAVQRGLGDAERIDAEDVRVGLDVCAREGAELFVVERPPGATLDEIFRAQEGAGFALVLATDDADVARRAGGELRLDRHDGLGGPTTFEALRRAPPDEDTARRLGWATFDRRTERFRHGGPIPPTREQVRAPPPGPLEIAPGHLLAVRWRELVRDLDTSDGPMEISFWTCSWGLPHDAYRLDPSPVPEGWVVLEGSVQDGCPDSPYLYVRAGGWSFVFAAPAALPDGGAPARVALDPAAARAF